MEWVLKLHHLGTLRNFSVGKQVVTFISLTFTNLAVELD